MCKVMWIVAVLAGCSSGNTPSSSTVDASSNPSTDGATVAKTAITVAMTEPPPIYIAYSDGDAGWAKLDPAAQTVSFEVRDRYRFIAVCDDGGFFFEIAVSARTVADGTTVTPGCVSFIDDTEPETVDVSTTLTRPGRLSVGGASMTSATANWSFSSSVSKGMHDVIATSTDHKVALQRLDFEADTTIPNIDLTAATPLRAIAMNATNVEAGATISNKVYLHMNVDAVNVLDSDPSATVYALPDALTTNVTAQDIGVTYFNSVGYQGAFQKLDAKLTGVMTDVALLPALGTTTFTKGTASWTTHLPDAPATLEAFDDDNFNWLHMTATPAYIGSSSALAISTDDIPDFAPEWHTKTDANVLDFGVDATANGVLLSSYAFPAVAFSPRAVVARSRAVQRHELQRARLGQSN